MSATGSTLKTLRESFGLSRMNVAAEFDLTDRWVEMLESGRINPNAAFVAKYTRAVVHASEKKKARVEVQLNAGSDQNPYQEEQIMKNATPETVPITTDTVTCTLQGCVDFGGKHEVDLGEGPHHVAFEWKRDMQSQVNVDYYEGIADTHPLEADQWVVNGVLSDDEKPLTPERVTEWVANYNSAVCLAAELNAQEVTC
ncbi:helix-turn-helix domain-containing protein [Curtobacterium pusillum]|uniref:helix-turn-helix domain-containing protein n=1 Tax=Curtobacterium pusillum TaxID=69373 RepID=UPI00380E7618